MNSGLNRLHSHLKSKKIGIIVDNNFIVGLIFIANRVRLFNTKISINYENQAYILYCC